MAKVQKTKKAKNSKKKREHKFRYSFLTLVLLLCLVHVGVSAFYNISKTISYQIKLKKMEQQKKQAILDNTRLKEELEDISLEAIARNKLKMAAEDEIYVQINKDVEPKKEKKVAKSFKFVKFLQKKNKD